MEKIYYLRLWLIAAMLSVAYSASAYDIVFDELYYNLNGTERTAEVTYYYLGDQLNPGFYEGDITIPSAIICDGIKYTVASIGDGAFAYCSKLTSVTIPESVTEIGDGAFFGCDALTSLTIPNSVTSIGESAFSHCRGLTSVTISNSLTKISNVAFSYCSKLTSVTIPESVTEIGDEAFVSCVTLTSLTIPNSVTSIGDRAFSHCYGISKITIPKTVKAIGSKAFDCNDNLEVYVEWEDPSNETLSFAQQPFSDAIMQYGKLFVPECTKAIYEQYDPWRNFFNIEEYTVDGIEEIEAEGGVTIGVEGGKIVVNGAGDAKVEVFGTTGSAVYSGAADNLPELAAGIYIVRIGSTVKKVAVAQ